MCPVAIAKTGQEAQTEQLKVDCYILYWLSILFPWMWIMTPIICFWWKKKWYLASCEGVSEEFLNYILSWKYTSCHLSLGVRIFHLPWKFRLVCDIFLKKKIVCHTLWMCCAYLCFRKLWPWLRKANWIFHPTTDLGMVLECPGNQTALLWAVLGNSMT